MRRLTRLSVILALACFLLPRLSFAHPSSGIVVDAHGHIYLLYRGLMQLDSSGTLTTIRDDTGGHWLTLNPGGAFSNMPSAYKQVSRDGTTMLYGDGAPLTVTADGNLYYATDGSQTLPTGALAIARVSHSGQPVLFSPSLQQKLAELEDGITGLASDSHSSIYVATWKGIFQLNSAGSIVRSLYPLAVPDCDNDPADHRPINSGIPLFRGIGVDSAGNIYAAATSCHQVVQITPHGQVTSILKSERPWTPTGIAVTADEIYVLEFTNANGPRTEGWSPRLRKRNKHGVWSTLVEVPPAAPPTK